MVESSRKVGSFYKLSGELISAAFPDAPIKWVNAQASTATNRVYVAIGTASLPSTAPDLPTQDDVKSAQSTAEPEPSGLDLYDSDLDSMTIEQRKSALAVYSNKESAEPDPWEASTRVWSDTLSATAYVPRSDEQIVRFVRGLLDRLIEALTQSAFSPRTAKDVGAQLVRQGFVGERSLGATVEFLGNALTAHEELRTVAGLGGKVTSLLGELASGYATALRRRTLEQQEEVKRTLVRAIREGEARFREVFSSTPVGSAISELNGTMTQTNAALADILGYAHGELVGRDVRELFHPDDARLLVATYHNLADGQRPRFRARVKLLDVKGETIWASLAVSLLRDAEGRPTHHVTMVEDVTDVHLLEERLRHQTLHDLLTGLPNQEYFWIHLHSALERVQPGVVVTLCKIDLDGFAVINDGHGHEGGNLVLRTVATRLTQLVADQPAMVARFGSDEFAIVIEESAKPLNPATLAEAINSTLAEPIYLGDFGLTVSAGIGVARRPGHGTKATELVLAADTTLHRAKRIGRAQWGLDDPHARTMPHAEQVMSGLPDVWRRVIAEHVPDDGGHCQACRDEGGFFALWPCLTRQIVEHAKRINDDPAPEFPPQRAVDLSSEPSASRATDRTSGRSTDCD